MSRRVLTIAWLDMRRVLRERETYLWTFAMPLVFFWFFSAMGGQGGGAPRREKLALEVPANAGFLAGVLEERLQAGGYDVERTAPGERAGEEDEGSDRVRRLVVPDDFTARVLRGEQVKPRFELASSERGNDFDRFRASRAAYTLVADLAALAAAGREVTPEALAQLQRAPRSVAVDEKPAGERRVIPSGAEQSVPGTMTMFTMICLLTSGAVGIVVDRRTGLLRRLAAAPLARGDVVAGKWLAILALGQAQIAFGAAAGTWLFGVDWGPDLAAVAALLTAWAAFNASAAVLLGTLARTEAQAIGAGVLGANLLSALGGCWWPIEVAPGWMQSLAEYLPTGWVMGALHDLAIFQTGPASALRSIAMLAAGALVLAALAARRFRFA